MDCISWTGLNSHRFSIIDEDDTVYTEYISDRDNTEYPDDILDGYNTEYTENNEYTKYTENNEYTDYTEGGWGSGGRCNDIDNNCAEWAGSVSGGDFGLGRNQNYTESIPSLNLICNIE